jgi:hypothetical protein
MSLKWEPGLTLDYIEAQAISQALEFHNYNKTHTARALGISIRTLRNKTNGIPGAGAQSIFRFPKFQPPPKEPLKPCTIEGCDKLGKYKAMCRSHYMTHVYRQRPDVKEAMRKRNHTFITRVRLGKSSAKRRGYEWKITADQLEVYAQMPCHYCQARIPEEYTGTWLDRRDNTKGYTMDNVVPCCGNCNTIKMNRMSEREMMAVAMVLDNLRKQA